MEILKKDKQARESIERLEKRIRELETRLEYVDFDEMLKRYSTAEYLAGVNPIYVKITGQDIQSKFREIYDYIGAERQISPTLKKLVKANIAAEPSSDLPVIEKLQQFKPDVRSRLKALYEKWLNPGQRIITRDERRELERAGLIETNV